MENLKQFLLQFGNLSASEWEMITAKAEELYLQKGNYFLKEGQICRKAGFVSSGILRIHHFDGNNDITRYFIKENEFGIELNSFHEVKPATKNIQAVTDCKLVTISKDSFDFLVKNIAGFSKIVQKITEHGLLQKVNDIAPNVVYDAKTKYRNFVTTQPELAIRVPLGYIASYLGITQQSLSRLRREMAW